MNFPRGQFFLQHMFWITPMYVQFEQWGSGGRSKFTQIIKLLLHNTFGFSVYSIIFLSEPIIQARLLEKDIAGGKTRLKQPEKQNKPEF